MPTGWGPLGAWNKSEAPDPSRITSQLVGGIIENPALGISTASLPLAMILSGAFGAAAGTGGGAPAPCARARLVKLRLTAKSKRFIVDSLSGA